MRGTYFVAGALLLSACARIDLSADEFSCEVETQCQEGWQCVDHVCRAVPGAPGNLVVSTEFRTATLHWSAPWANGGHPIELYRIYSAARAEGPFSLVAEVEGLEASVRLPGSKAWLRVTALNEVGEGLPLTVGPASLSTWQGCGPTTHAMARAFHGSLLHHGRLVFVGGGIDPALSPSVIANDLVQTTCSESWPTLLSSPLPRDGFATATLPRDDSSVFVFVSGGSSDRSFSNALGTTLVSRLDAAGTMSEWRTTGLDFPPRRDHASAVVRDHLFVIGGRDGETSRSDVQVAAIGSDGSLPEAASWRGTTPLPVALRRAAAVVYRDNLYVIGGSLSDGRSSADVWRASIGSDGNVIGGWQRQVAPLPEARSSVAAIVVDDNLIVIGGATLPAGVEPTSTSEGRLPSTLIAHLDAASGEISSWRTRADDNLWVAPIAHSVATDGQYLVVSGDVGSPQFARISDLIAP